MHLDSFDVLLKELGFNNKPVFTAIHDTKLNYPIDVYVDETGLTMEVALPGVNSELLKTQESQEERLLKITTTADSLSLVYNKPKSISEKEDKREYITRNISKRGMKLNYKISSKFDLSKLTSRLKDGMLTIHIPVNESIVRDIEIL